MNYSLLLFFFLLASGINTSIDIDYGAPTYYCMLKYSDLIIQTEIIDQTESTITLNIEEVLKGDVVDKTIIIKKFTDWPCASRHHPYEIGQRQIHMLRKLDDGTLMGMSPGNEGELPIDSGYIYLKSFLNHNSTYTFRYGRIHGFRFKLEESIIGLKKMIDLTQSTPDINETCDMLDIQPASTMESMIIEEEVLRKRRDLGCKRFAEYKFKVISNVYRS